MGFVGEFNHIACCLVKAKPGWRESLVSFRIPFERILLATGLWVFLDNLSNGVIFQRSQRDITLAVEEPEKFITRPLGAYDDRPVFVRGLNTTTFSILYVKERRRNAIVE
jgi:hypothetical protein